MPMKRFTIIAFALFLLPAAAVAQWRTNHGLVISGSVVTVAPVCISEKPAAQIVVYVQFRNESDEALIFIPPEFPYFDTRVKFVPESSDRSDSERVSGDSLTYNPYLTNPFGSPTAEDFDPKWSYVERLKQSKKPIKQIDPGGYYEFQNALWVRNGFKVTGLGSGKCNAEKIVLTPEYSHFTVEYYLSVEKYDGGTELLRKLRERWKPFGHLLLDDKGNISYRSENILFTKDSKQ